MYSPSLPLKAFLTFFGFLLLCHESEVLSMANPREKASEDHPLTSDSTSVPLRIFLSSISPQSPQLPRKGVSCEDLMPEALEGFADLPKLSQTLIRAALVLALQRAGCSGHAETLVLHLYEELGQKDTDDLLFAMAGTLNTTHSPGQRKSSVALQFNLDQLAQTPVRHCRGLLPVNGSLLHGKAHKVYRGFPAASKACHRLGDSCAGVASNDSSFFHVVERKGSYFLPRHGASSWLHQCRRLARGRRSTAEDCANETEEEIYAVLDWIPWVGTFYSFATSMYFAKLNCTELARERAMNCAIDISHDMLLLVTGGASSILGMGIYAGLKPGLKTAVRAMLRYLKENIHPFPVPSNYSGPVTIF
ncbi:apolipoprotein F-like [Lacerta agilis]|uniref:apolipoprotein F-like n=1 Tax=Lacerta agilis TaxID=80427 RepID=UPI0014195C5E|nr:apolipoprotein F-like [Lacerta agilis]